MALSKNCEYRIQDLIDTKIAIQDSDMGDAAKKQVFDRLFAAQLKPLTTWQKISNNTATWIVQGYLLNTKQIAANAFSALLNGAINPIVKDFGTLLQKATLQQTERKVGEGLAMYKAAFNNLEQRMRVAKETFDTGHSKNDRLLARVFNMSESEFKEAVTKMALSPNDERLFRQQMTDIYGSHMLPGKFGELYSLGARAGMAIDDFNQIMFKQMEFEALAYRAAENIAKKEGISEEAAIKSLRESVNFGDENYPEQMRKALFRMGYTSPDKALREMENSAAEAVFRGEAGKLLTAVNNIRRAHPLAGALTMPFVKIPTLIVNEGIAWVPVAGALHRKAGFDELGNFKGTDFAFKMKERRADLAAKQIMGSAAIAYIGSLYEDGRITGSKPEGGAPRYSVKIGDTWYSYSRFEPIATALGLGVDFHQGVKEWKQDPKRQESTWENIKKYGVMAMSSVSANVADKSFMQGLANFVEAVTAPDRNLENFLSSYANALVPSGVAQVAQMVDPVEREFVSFMDRIQARTPIWSKQLPEKYDVMGEPQQRGLLETVTGIQTKTTNGLLAALEKSGIDIKPSQKKVYGIDLDAQQLSMQRQLAGNYFKYSVDAMMKSKDWDKYDDSLKEFLLKTALEKSRSAANKEVAGYMLLNDPKFRDDLIMQKRMAKGMRDEILRERGLAPQQ
jgi:hypothetical protein